MARISVAVPSYNHARFLERCLRSVLAQTRPPDELIVIDDGSRDDSARVAERVLKDAGLPSELVVRPNKGVSATLNEALSRTRGEFFAYIGSDDTWMPRRLELGLATLEARPRAVLSHGHAMVIDAEDRRISSTETWPDWVDGDVRRALFYGRSIPANPTVLYRRQPLEQVGWREGGRLEDYELYLRLSTLGEFAFLPQVLGSIRSHGKNTSADHEMVLGELIAAQQRLAASLGFDETELAIANAKAKFKFADYLIDSGERLRGFRLSLQSAKLAAPGSRELLRRAAKLVLPGSAVRWLGALKR